MAIQTKCIVDQLHTLVHALLRSAPENNIELRLGYPAFVLPDDEYYWAGTFQIEDSMTTGYISLHIAYFLNHRPPLNTITPIYRQIRVDKTCVLYDVLQAPNLALYIHHTLQHINPTDIETEMRVKETQMMVGIPEMGCK